MKKNHKTYTLMAAIVLFTVFPLTAYAAEGDPAQQTVMSYFEALQSGNVESILDLITDPLRRTKKLLLEKNTAYPDYLRNYYKGAELKIEEIGRSANGRQTVDAVISFPRDSNPLKIRFDLKFSDTRWKIANESKPPY